VETVDEEGHAEREKRWMGEYFGPGRRGRIQRAASGHGCISEDKVPQMNMPPGRAIQETTPAGVRRRIE
jgi:hypothetical protein